MHQHYVTRARGKEGQATSCQGHESWIPMCNYTPALAPSWLSSEFRSFNNNALTVDPVPLYLTTTAAIPVTHSYGSLKPDTFRSFLLSPFRGVSSWTKHVCGVWMWRFLAPNWWFLLMYWWKHAKHAWHGTYCRSMKKHSHRNKLIMMVGFQSAPQSLASLELLQHHSEISCILWEVHSAFFELIALPSQPTMLFERSQVIIPIKGRDCEITARHRIRKRWSRWPEDKFLGYDQLKPLRYSVS